MNWYAIVSYYRYLKLKPLNGNINSVLAKIFIEDLKKKIKIKLEILTIK
jgi:hypothetical protein